MLSIAWQYLTGRCTAADVAGREAAEWPPHPDRVFMALVAAWGEGGRDPAREDALRWLEALGPPEVAAPEPVSESGRETVFVPVNDLEPRTAREYPEKLLGLLPAARPRKERCFHSVVVEDFVCALTWPDASPGPHRAHLARLCEQVTSIGHSRSLVRAWLCDEPPPSTWRPSDGRSDESLRVPFAGRLDSLERSFAGGEEGWSRPATAPWQGYLRVGQEAPAARGAFDPRMLVLRRLGGDRPGLLQAGAFCDALRAALLAQAAGHPLAEALVSGHAPTGGAADSTHLAFLPLADVGHAHADGHLLGLAVALPLAVAPEEEHALYALVADCLDPETGALRLVAGRAGACEFAVEERPAPPLALRQSTWARASTAWASVTPVVLDRLPSRRFRPSANPDRAAARAASQANEAYDAWVRREIASACTRQGLPEPVEIAVAAEPFLQGVPPARAFRPVARKPDGANRWHVHIRLVFSSAVQGPLVLGAGRYRGLGLLRPTEATCP